MQHFKTFYIPNIVKELSIATIFFIVIFYIKEILILTPLLLLGYVGAVCYFFMTAERLKKAVGQNTKSAKKGSRIGSVLRSVVLFLSLALAIKISKLALIVFVIGFFFCYGVILFNMILFSYREVK